MPSLTLTPLQNIPLIQPEDTLATILLHSLAETDLSLKDGDILILAQKIVSKAEGRLVNLKEVSPGPEAVDLARRGDKDPRLVELILQESRAVLRVRPGAIIVEHRLGYVCANAGIDHSNVRGDGEWVLLLPEDPDRSAVRLRSQLEAAMEARLGVMIIDSHGRAWRTGTIGVAIDLAGMPGLVDMRGKQDLFGYSLRITLIGAGDELAAAASLMMGQAAEGTPAVHVRGFPYPLREGNALELIRERSADLFR